MPHRWIQPAVQPPRPFDPVVTFRNSQGETARGTLTSLQRRALVMEIYNPYSIIQVSEVLNDLVIRSGDRAIYQGNAVVVSLLNTGLMALVSVALIDEWSELRAVGSDLGSIRTEAQSFVDDWHARFKVERGYMVAVAEIRTFLAELSRWTDQADLSGSLPRQEDGRLRGDVFAELSTPVIQTAANYFATFEQEIARVSEAGVEPAKGFAQTSLHPLVLRAPFVYRTFAKPLGYAGDYEMVNQILGDPQQGPTTYFQIVNTLFLASPVAQAHRNRIDILVNFLTQAIDQSKAEARVFRVLDIGCGPAMEIKRLLESEAQAERLSFTLMDFSEETLAYTEANLTQSNASRSHPSAFQFVNDSVHNLLKRAVRNEVIPAEEQFDYVYCAGLFDYLSDKVASRLLEYLRARTRPGGRILVTNVHPCNRQRGVMEHVLEWHLIYRDEEQLRDVLPRAREAERLYCDATGVNVFAEFTVPLVGGQGPQ